MRQGTPGLRVASPDANSVLVEIREGSLFYSVQSRSSPFFLRHAWAWVQGREASA